MQTLFRFLLDQEGLQDFAAFRVRFKEAAQSLAKVEGNPKLSTHEPAHKTFLAWYYGDRQPQRDSRRVLAHWWGYTVDQLWGPAPTEADKTASSTRIHEMKRTAQMAARRAEEFAMGAERGHIGDTTLSLLEDKVRKIVEEYPRVRLSSIWDDISEAQDQIFRILEGGRARPSQLRQLHFLAAIVSAHMAKGCHDMGDPRLAMTQARTAGVCAQQAEHDGMVALVYGLKSLIAFWSSRGTEAAHYARQGAAETSTAGTVPIWLAGLEARACALLGDVESAHSARRHAQTYRERATPDDLDGLGGLLHYSPAKQLYYDVETRVLLGEGGRDVALEAEEAVRGFTDTDSPDWAFGDQAGTQCNLALTRLHNGEVEGTAEAVRPVLDLAPALRNRGIIASAQRVASAVTRSAAHDTVAARTLLEEIEAYGSNRPALPL